MSTGTLSTALASHRRGAMEAASRRGIGAAACGSSLSSGFHGVGARRLGGRVKLMNQEQWCVSVRATSTKSPAVEFETGEDERARYAGDDPVAKLLNSLIAIKPIYDVMKFGAKNVMIRTAEKNGIRWKEMVQDMEASEVYAEKEKLENASIIYPDYYRKPFHGYDTGNLSWQAAFEVDPATMALWKRVYPKSESWQAAAELSRGKWVEAIDSHHAQFSQGMPVTSVLDIGCSTASSTRFLADHYNSAEISGLDLSPYFLSVAQYREREVAAIGAPRQNPIRFIHANAESTDLPSKSFDIVSIAYVLHECPRSASINIIKEAHRLLRPGGTIAITDHSPKSKVIQKVPPALWTMMKSTEPWLDEFYLLDLEAELLACGFTSYHYVLTDPRHFTCTATAAS